MKILLLSKGSLVDSYKKRLEYIGKYVDLTVVVPLSYHGREYNQELLGREYRMIPLPIYFSKTNHFFFLKHLKRTVQEIQPDIIHLEEEPYNLLSYQAIRIAKRAGTKVIAFSWQNIYKKFPFPFSYIEKKVLEAAAAGIAGNNEVRYVMRKKGCGRPIFVIPQFGVDTSLFKKKRESSIQTVRIGYIGRLVKEKGVDLLIQVLPLLDPKYHLYIIGDGSYKTTLSTLTKRLSLSSRVHFLGHVASKNIPSALKNLDLLVLPSRTMPHWKEQFGMVLIEAMAANVPVIGSSSGEIPQVIQDAGLIFKEDSLEDLRAKILMLSTDVRLRHLFCKRARARVGQYFTAERIAQKIFAAYKEVGSYD